MEGQLVLQQSVFGLLEESANPANAMIVNALARKRKALPILILMLATEYSKVM